MTSHQDQVADLLALTGKRPGAKSASNAAAQQTPPPPPSVKTEQQYPPRSPKRTKRAPVGDPAVGKARSVRLDRDVSNVVWPAVWATHSTLTKLLLDAARSWHRTAADLPDPPVTVSPAPDPDDPFPARQTREPLRRVNHHPYLTGAELAVLDQLADKANLDRATFCSRVLRRHLTSRVFVPASTALPEETVLLQQIQVISASLPAAVPQERQPWVEIPAEVLTDPVRAALSTAANQLNGATWTEVMVTALT